MSLISLNNEKTEVIQSGPIVALFFTILVLWLVTPFASHSLVGLENAGALGDAFGSINALFSGLAFAGVICAILLQRQELRLQRQELALTRTELHRTSKAQETSSTMLGEQAEVMKVTAHLNGLSTLIQAASYQIEHLKSINVPPRSDINDRIEKLINSRQDQIHELECLMHAIRCAAEYPYAH